MENLFVFLFSWFSLLTAVSALDISKRIYDNRYNNDNDGHRDILNTIEIIWAK